ncbi:MAG: homoserine kinase [Acidobacteriota bacterium]
MPEIAPPPEPSLVHPVPGTATSFAPASVSNLACGFDVLGFAVEGLGDRVTASLREAPGVEIEEIHGDGGRLPRDAALNTAGVAARRLLELAGIEDRGVTLRLDKGLPLGSGLGSSAASAVAGAHAAAAALGLDADRELLLRCALAGEQIACNAAHPDNAAPCLWGGLVLARSVDPLDLVSLPVPSGLACALVRPHVEVATRSARAALGDGVKLVAAVRQWANLGAFVHALHTGDLELLGRSLEDHVAEPLRAPLVPGFGAACAAARGAGALGASLSGSGPTIFALCADRPTAERVADAMFEALAALEITADRMVTAVDAPGVRTVDDPG